jgi:GTPase Era involved in 16S rRNA processing
MEKSELFSPGKLAKVCVLVIISFLYVFVSTILGKSALGNVILAKEEFVSKRSMKSETSVCRAGERVFDGRRLIVVDTPGLFDTNADPKLVEREIGNAVRMSSPGPHCFIITISARNRFTDEAQRTINLLSEIFGGNILEYCIVLFTNEDAITDEDITFDQWLPEQTKALPTLADLMNKCDHRCMAFNSKSKSTSQHDRKVRRLLSMIDRMVAKNGGRVYTNDMYKQAEAAARQREEEQLRKKAKKEGDKQRKLEEVKTMSMKYWM